MKTPQLDLAREIAIKAHDGQFRWDGKTPYIAHPAAIAQAVIDNWGGLGECGSPEHAMAAAWLHDVVEDTPLTIADLRAQGIDEEILTAVDLLTKRDGEEYLQYLLRLRCNEIARIVKIQDIKNNMSDLDRKKKKSMYEKYQLALYIIGG